jgi:hypothetical protein
MMKKKVRLIYSVKITILHVLRLIFLGNLGALKPVLIRILG